MADRPGIIPLKCAECGTPIADAYLHSQTIVIKSLHHGKLHVTVLTLPELIQMLQQPVINIGEVIPIPSAP